MKPEALKDRDNPAQATRRVARNAAFLALADVCNKALSFLYYVIAARRLGVGQFGVLSFAVAFVTMLTVLSDLGLGTVLARDVARNPAGAQPQFGYALGLKLVVSLLVTALIIGLASAIGYPPATIRIVSICGLSVIAASFATYYCWLFQGFERMELVAVVRFVQTAVMIGGAVVIPLSSATAERYALLYVVAVFSSLLAAVVVGAGLIRFRLSFRLDEWWKLARASLPLGLAVVFTTFYYWIGTTVLSKLSGAEAVGSYSAAFRLVTGMTFASFAFSSAVFPLFSRLFVSDAGRWARALERSVKYMIMLILPTACFTTVFARHVISALYGGAYSSAVVVLRVLVWWGVCASLNSLVSNYLLSANRSRVVAWQTSLSLGVNLVLNLALVRVLAAVGSAVSIVAAEAVGFVLLVILLQRSEACIRVGTVLKDVVRTSVALLVSLIAAAVALHWSVIAALVLGPAFYLLLLLATGGVGRDDWTLLRPLVRGDRG